MSHYDRIPNCSACASYIAITQAERTKIQPFVEATGREISHLMGVCSRSNRVPLLLFHEFIFEIPAGCPAYEYGFHKESLGMPCPVCRQGELEIRRPIVNGQMTILIGCDHYPACKYAAKQIALQIPCRHCATPLMLSGGDILRCFCPRCNSSLQIPLSLRIWPLISKPKGGCVHFPEVKECKHCDTSRTQRKSLIELEIADYIEWQNQKKSNVKVSENLVENNSNSQGCVINPVKHENSDFEARERYYEAMNTRKDYLEYDEFIQKVGRESYQREYHDLLNEESDGDWFSN